MGKKYIKDFPLNITPQTSGYTIYEDGIRTYKTPLNAFSNLYLPLSGGTYLQNTKADINEPKFTGTVKVQDIISTTSGGLLLKPYTGQTYINLFEDVNDSTIGSLSNIVGGFDAFISNVYGNYTDGSLNNNIIIGTRGHGFQTEIKGDLIMLRTRSIDGSNNYDITLNQSGIFNMTGATSVLIPSGTTSNSAVNKGQLDLKSEKVSSNFTIDLWGVTDVPAPTILGQSILLIPNGTPFGTYVLLNCIYYGGQQLGWIEIDLREDTIYENDGNFYIWNGTANFGEFIQTGKKTDISGKADKSINETITLQSSGWTANSITVSAIGVTTTNTVIISAPTNRTEYLSYGSSNISCTGQNTNTLTFVCDMTPNINITLNIKIE